MRVNKSCTVCGKGLSGKQKMYCSSGCKGSYAVRKEYLSKNVQYQHRYRQTKQGKYQAYISNAKIRNREFSLTFEEFCSFWNMDCAYCGSEIKTIGLDRVDSYVGYTINNIVSCCWKCNRMKSAMNSDEFVSHIIKISENIKR